LQPFDLPAGKPFSIARSPPPLAPRRRVARQVLAGDVAQRLEDSHARLGIEAAVAGEIAF